MLTQVCSQCVSNMGHIIQLPLKHRMLDTNVLMPKSAQASRITKKKHTQIELLCQFFYYFRKNFPNIFEGQEVDSNLLAILRSSEALVVSGTVRSLQQWKLILSARDFSRDASPALANLFSPGYRSMNWLTRINTASKKEEQAVTCQLHAELSTN